MLTDGFYRALAADLARSRETHRFLLAVGAGEEAWDRRRPEPGREVDELADELARKAVPADRVEFLGSDGRPVEAPTTRIRFSADFGPGEGAGSLRECGLFRAGRAGGDPVLLSYFTHERIDKPEGMRLARSVVVDLTPRALVPGTRETRWLANTGSGEFHDLERAVARCQVEEIRPDRRFYFPSEDAAVEAGYDFCAYCFGRDRSEG